MKVENLIEREQLRKMKMKDMPYYIKGTDSNRPINQCMEAVIIGLSFPLLLAIIVRIANYLITGS